MSRFMQGDIVVWSRDRDRVRWRVEEILGGRLHVVDEQDPLIIAFDLEANFELAPLPVTPQKEPHALLWLDLETTGLDPREDHILELAYQLTTFPIWPRLMDVPVPKGEYLVRGPGRNALLDGGCSAFIVDMHEKSGLLAALLPPEGPHTTLARIEADLLTLSQDWPLDKSERVVLAGFSVGLDLEFLRVHMPTFAARLSHRVFDVSSHILKLRSLGMPPFPKADVAHRAMQDLDAAIAQSNECSNWILGMNGGRS